MVYSLFSSNDEARHAALAKEADVLRNSADLNHRHGFELGGWKRRVFRSILLLAVLALVLVVLLRS